MSQLITPEIRGCIGRSAPPVTVQVTRRDIRKYAAATGQRLSKYADGDEAPPLFHFDLFREIVALERLQTDGLAADALMPELPLRRILFGGQETVYHRPIRPGDVLVGTRKLVDLYEKSGATGPLIFVNLELAVETDTGEPVLTEISTFIVR